MGELERKNTQDGQEQPTTEYTFCILERKKVQGKRMTENAFCVLERKKAKGKWMTENAFRMLERKKAKGKQMTENAFRVLERKKAKGKRSTDRGKPQTLALWSDRELVECCRSGVRRTQKIVTFY